jgi:Ca2+-transporting ATPase
MNSMGALALATERPTPALLGLQPQGRKERLISRTMWLHILVQGLYQVS